MTSPPPPSHHCLNKQTAQITTSLHKTIKQTKRTTVPDWRSVRTVQVLLVWQLACLFSPAVVWQVSIRTSDLDLSRQRSEHSSLAWANEAFVRAGAVYFHHGCIIRECQSATALVKQQGASAGETTAEPLLDIGTAAESFI